MQLGFRTLLVIIRNIIVYTAIIYGIVTLIGCGDTEFITRELIDDVASCYDSTDTTPTAYIISLDKNCIDFAISGTPLPTPQPPPSSEWQLLSELPIKENHRSVFHVWRADSDKINQAFMDGYDFLFIISAPRNLMEQQFYLRQPSPHVPPTDPVERALWRDSFRFHYPTPPGHHYSVIDGWRHPVLGDVDTSNAGWTFQFNIETKADALSAPTATGFMWPPEFGLSLDGGTIGFDSELRINDGVTLKIYIR